MANKTHKLQVPVEPSMYRRLKVVAQAECLPVTALVRIAINRLLASKEESQKEAVA